MRPIVLAGHTGSGVAQHLRQFFGAHAILQGEDSAGVAQVREPDVVKSRFGNDLLVHPSYHLR